jgi:hypothetical protein
LAVGQVLVTRTVAFQTIVLSAIILAVVVFLDWLAAVVLFPDPKPYDPWSAILITLLVAPPAIAILRSQSMRINRAQADLARERAARIEEVEKARDEAEAATRAKSLFLANMSHEIRTPLNGVLGMTQALEATPLNPDARAMVSTIKESSATLMIIVNDVLDLSKIESGRMEIFPVDGRVADILESVQRLFRPEADEKGIGMSVSIDPSLPERLSFDPVRVRQCLSNLVSNAVKFTRQGRVSIHASAAPELGRTCVSIRVTDTGPGIDRKTQDRLFHAFTQADESTTRQFGGTGLGLTIARDLARLMGGDILVSSKPGEGAEFTFHFVADAASPVPKSRIASRESREAAAERHSRMRGARVLLTDDNTINRQVARLFLQPQGAVITEAVNGKEALDLLSTQPFDLVLLDCNMPVMDGMEAIARIRASGEPWSTLPVIALTANAMSGDRERLLALGMSGYVSKPIDRIELYAEIERVLGGGGALAAAARPPAGKPATAKPAAAKPAAAKPANDGPDIGDILGELDRIAKR